MDAVSERRVVSGTEYLGPLPRDIRFLLAVGPGRTAQLWGLVRLRPNSPAASAMFGASEGPDRLFALGFCILRLGCRAMLERAIAGLRARSRRFLAGSRRRPR